MTIANLQPGEVVLNLGGGGGLGRFLSAKRVGTGDNMNVDVLYLGPEGCI